MATIGKKSYAAGESVFRQGDGSTELYHIQTGRVGIFITRAGADMLLAELGPGSLFGEMALINGPPRTASAVALEPLTVTIVPEEVFRQNAVGLPPWSLSIARVLAERLKNTTVSLDKLLYEKSHTVDSQDADLPASLNIVPQSLEITYHPESDAQRLYLSGVLDTAGLEELLNKINGLRRQGISPVILSFSTVIDAQRKALETIISLAKTSSDASGRVQLENVQFIADKFLTQGEIQEILVSDQTPVRRVGYGDSLIRQGDPGTEMYVVKTGGFSVSRRVKDKEIILWTAGEGDVIGEMALISGKVRTASVLATKSSQVYVIDIVEFRKNAYHVPKWFMGIIEGLVTRLRNTDKKLDEFATGDLHPLSLSEVMSLEIFENVRAPGTCRMTGSLTASTLKTLKTYVAHRIRSGVRQFHWDVTEVKSVDATAVRFLVKLQRYLLNARGTLEVKGPRKMAFPPEL